MSKLTGRRIENTYYKLLQIDHIDGDGQGDGVVMQNGLGHPITGSINVSGSFHITGSATIRKDLRVLGNVTAQQFIATTVSSSVVYESGSSQFGNSLDDKHLYTGSLLLTGSQLTSGSATITGSLKALGSTEITGSINTLGVSLVTGSLEVLGDAELDGETNITGTLDLTTSGSWVVEGKKQLTGPIANVGDFQQYGDSRFEANNVTINSTNIVTSGSSIRHTTDTIDQSGYLTHTGPVDIDGPTMISGQTTILGPIDHTGDTTHIGNLNQVGDALISGNQTISGSSNISGSSYVRGTVDSNVTGDSTITGSFRVNGTTDIRGAINQKTTGGITHTGSIWRNGTTEHKGLLDLDGSYVGKGNWSYQGFYNLSATGSIVQVGGNYDLTGDLFVKGNTEFTGSLGVTEDITTPKSLRAARHIQTQLISYPKTLTTDATVDPDHYSYLYGPISIAEGTTITVEQDSILTIH